MKERKINTRRQSDEQQRARLELILREEEEWQQLVMYRRDFRFLVHPEDEKFYKLQMERTIIDMLHCPMRMHEKILTLLYTELLNGKTKHEVNDVVRRTRKYLPPAFGVGAVGMVVAKEFSSDDGVTSSIYEGCVQRFLDNADGGLYTIRYHDGDTEDMDCEEFCDAHELAATMPPQGELTIVDEKTAAFRKGKGSSLTTLTDIIRHLGELGPTWTHQWSDTDSKALKKIKLPFDQSKKIFKVSNIEKLQLAVDTAVDASKPELRSNWKTFLSHYVKAIMNLVTLTP